MKYLVVTIKKWNINNFNKWNPLGKKYLITKKEDLTLNKVKKIDPQYIFFPHWSWKIPKEIYENYECIVFHETDLPFGRGGSPIQNLILRGIYKTKITAIRVNEIIDGGDIYLKRDFDLSEGSAQELFEQMSEIYYSMMDEIIEKTPEPTPQKGRVVTFKRRTPEQSEIPKGLDGRKLYDFIRMLDAEGYPKAFIKIYGRKILFSNAKLNKIYIPLKNDYVTALCEF